MMTMTITRTINHKRRRWWGLLLAATALFASLRATAEDAPPVDPPAGELLIASEAIQDPRFQHSVVLLLRHDSTGAFGIVINHPLAERPLAALLADTGSKDNGDSAVEGTIRVFLGGPVQPEYGFVIHTTDYHRPETQIVADQLAMTGSTEVLRDIGTGHGPKQSLIAFGYAGWAPQQLDDELARGAWVAGPENPALVFDTDRAKVWTDALALYKNEH